MQIDMNLLFNQIHKLPQIPEVIKTLINQLNDPLTDIHAIAKNIEKEQVIALKILRLVNSAHFGLSRKVSSLDEATVMLGMSTLKTLIIASGLVSAIPPLPHFDLKKFWNNSFKTAVYAKWIASQCDLSPDMAYTAGLLGNLGEILIHMSLTQLNEESEKYHLNFSHQAVCAELCRRWHFAEELVNGIGYSDAPLEHEQTSKIACCLHIAQYLSHSASNDLTMDTIMTAFPKQVAEQIGLSANFFESHLPDIFSLESELEVLLD